MSKRKHKNITYKDIANYKKLPNRKKAILTNEFLITFKRELINIFAKNDIRQDREPLDYENGTYWSFYQAVESTCGFYEALENACKKHNITKAIYEYSKNMNWYESDTFDSNLTELMVKRGIIKEGKIEDYCSNDELCGVEESEVQRFKLIKSYNGYNVVTYDWCFKDDIAFIKDLCENSDKELIFI